MFISFISLIFVIFWSFWRLGLCWHVLITLGFSSFLCTIIFYFKGLLILILISFLIFERDFNSFVAIIFFNKNCINCRFIECYFYYFYFIYILWYKLFSFIKIYFYKIIFLNTLNNSSLKNIYTILFICK